MNGPIKKVDRDNENHSQTDVIENHSRFMESARSLETVQVELPFPPSGNRQTRHTKAGGHYIAPEVARYRARIASLLAGKGWGRAGQQKPLCGPLNVSVVAVPDSRRAMDADNRLKCLLDALVHGGLLADDSNRVVRRLAWEWCDAEGGEGRVLVSVECVE
jgi:Holliday junction resolvase RusA-like endonuclease